MRRVGRRFYTDSGIFRPRFVSGFRLPSRMMWPGESGHVERYLDWALETGFNGVRCMLGGGWLASHLDNSFTLGALEVVLLFAKERGLYVSVSALCNTGTHPVSDKVRSVRNVALVCARVGNAVLVLANETGHWTQDSDVHDVAYLRRLYGAVKVPNLIVALGAADIDELDGQTKLYPTAGGDFCTAHLRRSKPLMEQVARLRELETISATHGVPVSSEEPLGADEQLSPQKQRYIDPDFAFLHGAYCRIAELGAVHHAEHGLHADLPGPNQQRCAEAFIAGCKIADDMGELKFYNARAGGGPVAEANFMVDAHGNDNPNGTVYRMPAGIDGNRGIVLAIGPVGDRDPRAQWANGFAPVAVRADRPMVTVFEVAR